MEKRCIGSLAVKRAVAVASSPAPATLWPSGCPAGICGAPKSKDAAQAAVSAEREADCGSVSRRAADGGCTRSDAQRAAPWITSSSGILVAGMLRPIWGGRITVKSPCKP